MELPKIKDVKNYIKELSPSETRKYDVGMAFLLVFILIYAVTMHFYTSKAVATAPAVLNVNVADFHELLLTNTTPRTFTFVFDTKQTNQFVIGELVNVRGFNILGVVISKTLGISGYKYEIMYKSGDSVQRETFEDWMVSKPTQSQITPLIRMY